MGNALFDRQLVAGHMVHVIYKCITFKDIKSMDEEYYTKLKQLQQFAESGGGASMLCLDFSIMQEIRGVEETINLIEGRENLEVANNNLP